MPHRTPIRLLCLLALLMGASAAWAESIVCDSVSRQYRECPVPGLERILDVRKMSRADCVRGRSWGRYRNGIWVDHGCRAVFDVRRGHRLDNPPQHLTCSSMDRHRSHCAADTRGRSVRLVRQRSSAACKRGYSWGVDRRGIWVDHGCRAEFAIHGDGRPDRRSPPPRGPRDPEPAWLEPPQRHDGGHRQPRVAAEVRCESRKKRRKTCPAPVRNNKVVLHRQLSKRKCVRGETWGRDRRGIWVDHGCRGIFRVIERAPMHRHFSPGAAKPGPPLRDERRPHSPPVDSVYR